jgi:hypothetical protein
MVAGAVTSSSIDESAELGLPVMREDSEHRH